VARNATGANHDAQPVHDRGQTPIVHAPKPAPVSNEPVHDWGLTHIVQRRPYVVHMAERDPLRAIGSVFDLRRARRAGTCCAFRRPRYVLTAAHCVDELEPGEVEIEFLAAAGRHGTVEVVRHPTADLALLLLEDAALLSGVEPFTELGRVAGRGSRFAGFGSSEGAASLAEARERLFAGRFRRTLTDPDDGHLYADLSVPALDGFSGGPVFAPDPPHALLALITANRRRRLTLRGDAGHGIALLVGELSEWVDEQVPDERPAPPAGAE
jgi:hypothetical protein